jgi:predicted trehalose synthase
MTTPLPFIEEKLAERAQLESQLHMMENHLADPQRSPSFGTHQNYEDTTQANIDDVKRRIAEIDELIERMRRGNV